MLETLQFHNRTLPLEETTEEQLHLLANDCIYHNIKLSRNGHLDSLCFVQMKCVMRFSNYVLISLHLHGFFWRVGLWTSGAYWWLWQCDAKESVNSLVFDNIKCDPGPQNQSYGSFLFN